MTELCVEFVSCQRLRKNGRAREKEGWREGQTGQFGESESGLLQSYRLLQSYQHTWIDKVGLHWHENLVLETSYHQRLY